MAKIKIKFEGIDYWGRPIFKATESKERFGSVDILFDSRDTEQEVLNKLSESHLLYFGNSFGCEPMGTKSGDIEIIKPIIPEIFKIDGDEAIEHIVHVLEESNLEYIHKIYQTVCNPKCVINEGLIEVEEIKD